ncbi:hypothetical protein VB005_07623 [Metarhizium brunneum]
MAVGIPLLNDTGLFFVGREREIRAGIIPVRHWMCDPVETAFGMPAVRRQRWRRDRPQIIRGTAIMRHISRSAGRVGGMVFGSKITPGNKE